MIWTLAAVLTACTNESGDGTEDGFAFSTSPTITSGTDCSRSRGR
jgi:hypothetical protein